MRNEGYADHIALLLTEDCDNLQFGLHHYLFGEKPFVPPETYASETSSEAAQPISFSVGKISSAAVEISDIPSTEISCAKISVSHFLSSEYDKNLYFVPCTSWKNININDSINEKSEIPEKLKKCNPTYNYELLGPVRSAICMIGAREKEAVKKLEIGFHKKNLTSLLFQGRSTGNEIIKSADYDEDTNIEGYYGDQSWKREGFFYSACMTNPPFYDENEEVRNSTVLYSTPISYTVIYCTVLYCTVIYCKFSFFYITYQSTITFLIYLFLSS